MEEGHIGGLESGETITLSLEDATQIILQQQGLGEGEVQLTPGTYQILTHQAGAEGIPDGISVIHTTPEDLAAFGNQPGIFFQSDLNNVQVPYVGDQTLGQSLINAPLQEETTVLESDPGLQGETTSLIPNVGIDDQSDDRQENGEAVMETGSSFQDEVEQLENYSTDATETENKAVSPGSDNTELVIGEVHINEEDNTTQSFIADSDTQVSKALVANDSENLSTQSVVSAADLAQTGTYSVDGNVVTLVTLPTSGDSGLTSGVAVSSMEPVLPLTTTSDHSETIGTSGEEMLPSVNMTVDGDAGAMILQSGGETSIGSSLTSSVAMTISTTSGMDGTMTKPAMSVHTTSMTPVESSGPMAVPSAERSASVIDELESGINSKTSDKTKEPTDVAQQSTDPTAAGSSDQTTVEVPEQQTSATGESGQKTEKKQVLEKKPDLTCPIEVTDHTEVVINGRKCLLKVNPKTGTLCAYPVMPPEGRKLQRAIAITVGISGDMDSTGKKRRGRPRKQVTTLTLSAGSTPQPPSKPPGQDVDQTSKAAEGLLELSNTGPDGVRRSGRARKKASNLSDYEILEVSSEDETPVRDDDEDVVMANPKRKKTTIMKDYTPSSSYPVGGIKRGRGRPRRYPPPGQSSTPTQIPAMIIPSANGQTLMMAPIQGLSNLQALQEQLRSQPPLVPKVELPTDDATQFLNNPTISVASLAHFGTASIGTTEGLMLDAAGSTAVLTNELTQAAEAAEAGVAPVTSLTPDETDEAALPPEEEGEDVQPNPVEDNTAEDVDDDNDDDKLEMNSEETHPTIIQIPENLLPMFVQKKDPVKIGLKASETELERLKCPKCEFQAFYPQQYQNHIASHSEDLHKCKCCNYLTLEKSELLSHFKETHPRCICDVCDFMAEHAYVIKRHMMRHNADGCTCDLCGKIYKDQYILKMHIKMVHMPAEVLFECTICSKKFTRKAHLKRHLRIHDPEKPFKCPHCDYRGCERSDISKHLLIHEEPKHVCEVCSKAFRHIKNKELHVKRHKGQREYKCGVCDFYGYTFTDIRKHIERKHTDMKTTVCDKCGIAFKSEAQLREHRNHQCEVFMIEQALAIATSAGGTSQATIQIPSSLTIDGQQISLDPSGQVNITVEQISMPDDGIQLTEEQLQDAVTQGQVIDTGQVEMVEIPTDDVEHVEEELNQSVDLPTSEDDGIALTMSE